MYSWKDLFELVGCYRAVTEWVVYSLRDLPKLVGCNWVLTEWVVYSLIDPHSLVDFCLDLEFWDWCISAVTLIRYLYNLNWVFSQALSLSKRVRLRSYSTFIKLLKRMFCW